MNYRLPAALLPLALLAGCGEEPPVVEPGDNDGRSAEGEVIGGTISDAMLPLDTVRSQAPPAVAASAPGPSETPAGAAAPAARGGPDEAEPDTGSTDAPDPEEEADEDAT